MSLTDFQKAYRNLNPDQRLAVDTIEGPVMVVAGPGTGKTQILTLRIANILLKTQVNPANILALTLTTAAAVNMRERLSRTIGAPAYSVQIYTFHAFCQQIITEHPDDFWEILGRKLADDIQKVEVVEHILDSGTYIHIKPFGKPYFYVSDALRAISDLKREGVTPAEFHEIISRNAAAFETIPDKMSTRVKGKLKGIYQDQLKQIQKNTELAQVYEQYQTRLHARDLYDYDDLIMYTLEKLRTDEDFRLRLMEKYQYILVDEHQDSNNAQNKIIELLTTFHDNPNIFVVGDEKQAIFRFQGASVENFRSFKKLYPEAKLITLHDNYRSTQTILDGALELLQMEESQGLVSHRSAGTINSNSKQKSGVMPQISQKIQIVQCGDAHAELDVLVESIRGNIEKKVKPEEIAVLVRTRAHGRLAVAALERAQIPAYQDVSENIFEDPAMVKLIILLDAIYDYGNEEKLFRVFLLDFVGCPPLDVYKLTQAASRGRKPLYDLLMSRQALEKIGTSQPDRLMELARRIGDWHIKSHNEPLSTLLHTIVSESGLLTAVLGSARIIHSVSALRTFYDTLGAIDAESTWKLADFFVYLGKMREHGLKLQAHIRLQSQGKVQIMTVHGSKGLEFDHVYIPFVQENVWGGRGKPRLFKLPDEIYQATSTSGDDEDDAKRLFFVALTRARDRVTISYADADTKGDQILPSPFLSLIRPELTEKITTSLREASMSSGPTKQSKGDTFLAANGIAASSQNRRLLAMTDEATQGDLHAKRSTLNAKLLDFVQSSLEHYGISVSALNNYLSCPWKYFYVNLVRVPSGKNKTLMFGNAIHNALTYFFKHYKATSEKSRDYLLHAFEKSCDAESFTRAEYAEVLPRGQEFLRKYFDHYEDTWTQNVVVKMRIPDVKIPNVQLLKTEKNVILSGSEESPQFVHEATVVHESGGSFTSPRSVQDDTFMHNVGLHAVSETIKLTGEIDMMTYLDGSLSQVRVTDWKTGQAKSRNEILGKTKGSEGNYYRQLVFYKLLLKYFNPRLTMREGELDFIQPDRAGAFHREIFQIPDEEVVQLEATVRDVVAQIQTLSFWDRTCDDPTCEWCALRVSTVHKEIEGGLF